MLNFRGKIVFIALKKTIEDGGALCYVTTRLTLLLHGTLLVVRNCWGDKFIALNRTVEHWGGGGGGGIVIYNSRGMYHCV